MQVNTQVKYKLDKESLIKIGKGALIAGTGAAALYLLSVAGAIEISNPILASFLVWFIPFGTNFIKSWVQGEEEEEEEERGEGEPSDPEER